NFSDDDTISRGGCLARNSESRPLKDAFARRSGGITGLSGGCESFAEGLDSLGSVVWDSSDLFC
ncbi:MAG: hypothetical protein IJU23_11435, partial [Proteobacteria bacterium]|nr:hypothetical protein [Pseudomonadota bacterium]